MFARTLIALTVALFGVAVSAQTPIPNRPDGFASPNGGSADAPVVLDAFIDLLCPDSKAAWPTIKSLVDAYAGQVRLVTHFFPLPYHTWSFIVNQGALVIDAHSNVSAIYNYIDWAFAAQDSYSNAATASQSSTAVTASLATAVEKAGLLPASTFTSGIADALLNWNQRVSWKYACSRAVTGTPTFLLNGVFLNAQTTWTVSDWKTVIDPLLASTQSFHTVRRVEAKKPMMIAEPTCADGLVECQYLPGQIQCCTPGEMCIPNVGCRC